MTQALELRQKVNAAYSDAAAHPEGRHPFPVGRTFAEGVGYSAEILNRVPSISVEAFTGVSNVSVFAEIARGERVLDLGCGAGLDSFIAAERTGDGGQVLGIDFSFSMLERARHAQFEAGAERVSFGQADAERLPLPDGSIDVVLVNGIFNLNPNRAAIFRELGRVVKRGGTVFSAELTVREPLSPDQRGRESNWFA
ncbi:MAG: methyltransferase domain-containing protein [Acidobacteriia bacterium]|nr:methyltransferase domain-containing protein [Terriglobia bacterium]